MIAGEVAEPDSVTVPFASAMSGTSGEVAVAVPIVQPGPDPVRHGTSAPTFGVIDLPRLSVMLLLADSVAACVTPRTSWPPVSFASLVTVAVSAGAYGSVEQPVTLSGAVAVFAVESACESAVIDTLSAGLGQLDGIRSVVNERLISLIAIVRQTRERDVQADGGRGPDA